MQSNHQLRFPKKQFFRKRPKEIESCKHCGGARNSFDFSGKKCFLYVRHIDYMTGNEMILVFNAGLEGFCYVSKCRHDFCVCDSRPRWLVLSDEQYCMNVQVCMQLHVFVSVHAKRQAYDNQGCDVHNLMAEDGKQKFFLLLIRFSMSTCLLLCF